MPPPYIRSSPELKTFFFPVTEFLTLLRKIVLRDLRDFLEASREFVVCLF